MGFLAIDIGNTNITTGHFHGGELGRTLKIPSASDPKEFSRRIEEWLGGENFRSLGSVGISSVVRDLEDTVSENLAQAYRSQGLKPPRFVLIMRNSPPPLKSAYKPGMLGTDRMLGAVAGASLFGKPVITVDIGSAVTIDLVDGDGIFRGGFILAGAGFRTRALATFTSLLPEVPVPQSPPPLLGIDTVGCLSSGIYHGMRAEIQGLVSQVQGEVGAVAPVVVTGQGSRLFCEGLPEGWHIEQWLVLKGIYFACEKSRVRNQEPEGRRKGREHRVKKRLTAYGLRGTVRD